MMGGICMLVKAKDLLYYGPMLNCHWSQTGILIIKGDTCLLERIIEDFSIINMIEICYLISITAPPCQPHQPSLLSSPSSHQ